MVWTKEQEQFVVDKRTSGLTWAQVSEEMHLVLGISRNWNAIRMRYKLILDRDTDIGAIISENVRLAKKTQKFQDSNRVERKAFRNYARIENAITELNKEMLTILKDNRLDEFTIVHPNSGHKSVGILHLTDLHFNELVELRFNRYDFSIASKRLQKFVDKAKMYFHAAGVNNVLIAFSGDLINSDRRLDEILSQATNRSRAMFLATQILEQVIVDVNLDFNVTVASVSGNESRMKEHIGWTDMLLSDNYDDSIFMMLKYLFKGSEGITFITGGGLAECLINVAGQNVLIMHGNQKGLASKTENGVQSIVGKWADKGVIVDFSIFGHLHSAKISEGFARGGSPVGANAYSDNGLQLMGRASQNIHIFYEDGSRDSIKVDLQTYDGYEGYDISEHLVSYNAKSASKLNQNVTIFKVVI